MPRQAGPAGRNTTYAFFVFRCDGAEDRIEYDVEMLANVFGQEPQHKMAVLLQQLILAPIAPVRLHIGQVLGAVELDRQAGSGENRSTSMHPRPSKGMGSSAFNWNKPAVCGSVSSRRYRNASVALRARSAPF